MVKATLLVAVQQPKAARDLCEGIGQDMSSLAWHLKALLQLFLQKLISPDPHLLSHGVTDTRIGKAARNCAPKELVVLL